MDALALASIEPAHRLALGALSVLLFAVIFELVRREHLQERNALLWIATSVLGLIIGVFPGTIVLFAQTFHFQMITMLFAVSFLYVLGIVLSFTVIISRLSERNRRLAQEVALLAHRVQRVEENRSGI